MASKKALTGGTGDVNPQWFIFPSLQLSATDTITSASVRLPVSRIPQNKKATVIEVFAFCIHMPGYPPNAASQESMEAKFNISTVSQGTTTFATWAEPNVIALWDTNKTGAWGDEGPGNQETFQVRLLLLEHSSLCMTKCNI